MPCHNFTCTYVGTRIKCNKTLSNESSWHSLYNKHSNIVSGKNDIEII